MEAKTKSGTFLAEGCGRNISSIAMTYSITQSVGLSFGEARSKVRIYRFFRHLIFINKGCYATSGSESCSVVKPTKQQRKENTDS